MYSLHMRRALVVAALIAIAGCGGATTSSSLSPTGQGSSPGSLFVHKGVPFAVGARHANVARFSPQTTYATKNALFEADQQLAAVNVYQDQDLKSNPAPVATIHVAAGCPYGLAMDKKGTLYVADNCGGNDVEEYPKGSTTEKLAITNGVSNPLGAAVDKKGTLYVSNFPASITEYKFGTTSPSKTITGGGLTDPFGVALDASGNLFVADFGALQVFEIPAGTTTVTALNLQGIVEPIGVAVDQSTGDLWVTDGQGAKVNVYPPGSTSPSQTITGFSFPYAISIQSKGKPLKGLRSVAVSDINTKVVYAFKPGKTSPYATLSNGVALPTGVLVTKP
jgi:DNA-binding beta-propeller fold protein YncE